MPRYAAGAVLIRLADEGARVALVLLALQRTHSAAVGGALVAALLVPHVVAAPVAGLLTDRASSPRRVLAGAATCFAAALATVATVLGHVPLGLVIAVLLAAGACGPALTGGITSQLPALVPAEALPRAFGVDSLTYNVAGIVGPAIAGTVAAIATPGAATAMLAASAACGAAVVATLPIAARQEPPGPPVGVGAGAALTVRDPVLAAVTLGSGLGQLGPGALPVVGAVAAGRMQAPAASGWLMTAVAAGGLLGSLLWTWRPAAAPAELRAQVFALGARVKTTTAAAGAAAAGLIAHAPTATLLLLVGASPVLAGALGAVLLSHHGPAWSRP